MAFQKVSNTNIVTFQWYESLLLVAERVQADRILLIDATNYSAEETEDRNTIK